MHRHLSYLLAFSALSITALPQSIPLARTSGPAAAPAIRKLTTGDTQQPQPPATQAAPAVKPAPTAQPAATTSPITAGKKLISGTINEKGSGPLEGVVIATKDGKIVSGSMQDGQYYIEIPTEDSILLFSLEGYATQEIKLHDDDNECSVTLQPAVPVIPAPSNSARASKSPSTSRSAPGIGSRGETPFPTTILIDRKGRVAEIHLPPHGGPATGPYYQEFLKEFNAGIDRLLTQ